MNKAPRYFIWDYILAMSVFAACTGPIISKLTMYFGFSLALSNFINAFATILPMFQLAGSLAYGMSTSPVHFLRHTNGIWRLYFPLVFFSVLLPGEEGKWMMVISYMLTVGILQFSNSAQVSWMSSCVDSQVGPDYYSKRETWYMVVFTAFFCIVSLAIDYAEKNQMLEKAFIGAGIFASIMMAISLCVLMRIPAPPTNPRKMPNWKGLLEPLMHKDFKRVILSNVAWNVSINFLFCFSVVYQVQVLKLSFFSIMLWTTIANTIRTLCIPAAGKLGEKIGWPRLKALCCVLMAVSGLVWAMTSRENSAYLYPVAMILCTLPYSGLSVGFMKTQIAASPEDSRSIYIAVLACMSGLAALIGSVVSSSALHYLENLPTPHPEYIFYVGIVVTLLAAVTFAIVRNPEERSTADDVQ